MRTLHPAATIASLATLLGAASCGPPTVSDPGPRDPFIAFAADFKGFHDWPSFDVTATAQPGTVHPDAQLIEYINTPPPTGSTAFPVGTIIVKEQTDGEFSVRQFFAMVKRGGGYNPDGVKGWEWFDLQNLDSGGGVRIVWHGVGPPSGTLYGGDASAGCNSCHADCGNDGVCAPALALGSF